MATNTVHEDPEVLRVLPLFLKLTWADHRLSKAFEGKTGPPPISQIFASRLIDEQVCNF